MDVFIERQQISLGLFHIDRLISTVKLRAVDRSAIQFLSNFGVLLTEMCYYYINGHYSIFEFFGGATK